MPLLSNIAYQFKSPMPGMGCFLWVVFPRSSIDPSNFTDMKPLRKYPLAQLTPWQIKRIETVDVTFIREKLFLKIPTKMLGLCKILICAIFLNLWDLRLVCFTGRETWSRVPYKHTVDSIMWRQKGRTQDNISAQCKQVRNTTSHMKSIWC